MSMTIPWRRVLSRLSNTRKSIVRNITIWRKPRHRCNSSWRKSITRNAYILRSAIVRHASSRSLCRFQGLGQEEQWHETNTQCVGEEELLVPKCDANNSADRHAGGGNVDFRGGERFPPESSKCAWPAIFSRATDRRCSSPAGQSVRQYANVASSVDRCGKLLGP